MQRLLGDPPEGNGRTKFLLDVQYRMHPAISALPSSLFYNNQIR